MSIGVVRQYHALYSQKSHGRGPLAITPNIPVPFRTELNRMREASTMDGWVKTNFEYGSHPRSNGGKLTRQHPHTCIHNSNFVSFDHILDHWDLQFCKSSHHKFLTKCLIWVMPFFALLLDGPCYCAVRVAIYLSIYSSAPDLDTVMPTKFHLTTQPPKKHFWRSSNSNIQTFKRSNISSMWNVFYTNL